MAINDKVWKFFDEKQLEVYLYDSYQKDRFEIFESLKIYIERVLCRSLKFSKLLFFKDGTPFNYLESEEFLKQKHFEYYQNMNSNIIKDKDQKFAE